MGYSRSPRFGGEPLHRARVVSCRYEHMSTMPDSDFEAEGFRFLATQPKGLWSIGRNLVPAGTVDLRRLSGMSGEAAVDAAWSIFRVWRKRGGYLWVCRFEHVAEKAEGLKG